MKFSLKIHTGNGAMQTWQDIARALEDVARLIREELAGEGEVTREAAVIMDANGNIVGRWSTKAQV